MHPSVKNGVLVGVSTLILAVVTYISSCQQHSSYIQTSLSTKVANFEQTTQNLTAGGDAVGRDKFVFQAPGEFRNEKNLACSFHVETMNNLEKLKKLREDFGSKNFTCGNYIFIFDDFNKFGSDFKEYDLTVQSKNFSTFLRDICSFNSKEKISQAIGSGENVIRLLEMYYGCQRYQIKNSAVSGDTVEASNSIASGATVQVKYSINR